MMKRPHTLLLPFLALLVLATSAAQTAPRTLNVGFLFDGPWERNEEILDVFQKAIHTVLERDAKVQFLPKHVITADWTLDGITAGADKLLKNPQVNVVIGLGLTASHVLARRQKASKRILAPYIIDREAQALPFKKGSSGVKNLNYLVSTMDFQRAVRIFHEVVPFKRLGILINAQFLRALPQKNRRLDALGKELKFSTTVFPVGNSASQALTQLNTKQVDAVIVAPQFQLEGADYQRLLKGLANQKIPSFSLIGGKEIERGCLIGMTPPKEFARTARRTALNLQRSILGDNLGTLPVAFPPKEQLTINMATARAIGFSPKFKILTEAKLLHEERQGIKRLVSLESAIRDGIAQNLDLETQRRAVAVGRRDVQKAWSGILPHISANATGGMIDDSRASRSFGASPEKTFSAGAQASQMVFSDSTVSNISVEKRLQEIREHELEQIKLDISRDATVAYLDVLRTKTLERVQKENLNLTRSNYELALVRRKIGVAGPSEVYRWQNSIAINRRDVIQANSLRNISEIELNRLLHRPLEENFRTEDASLSVLPKLKDGTRAMDYLDTPWGFKKFREFMVNEGYLNSPELQRIEANLRAQRTILGASKRTFFLPDIFINGNVDYLIAKGGAGSNPANIPGLTLPPLDDLAWGVGATATLPLFTGASRIADAKQAAEEVERLTVAQQSIRERVDQSVRSSLHRAGASKAGIDLSREAAEAARKNLEVVTAEYSRGTSSILDLLDAQNVSLVAEQSAANSVYVFLTDLMEVQRAAGKFIFFQQHEGLPAFRERLKEFMTKTTEEEGVR